jgi:MFS family permease
MRDEDAAHDLGRDDLLNADATELDDEADQAELRQRYYGLLQELRVVLPGVQVLMAFLLTAPFARRFDELDDAGRDAYLVALVSTLGSIICLLGPTVFHRVGERTARAARLIWGVRLQKIGVVMLAIALTSATWCVVRLVYGASTAAVVAAVAVALLLALWLVLPLRFRSQHRR